MTRINLDRIQEINKWSITPLILRVSDKFIYNVETGVFDNEIKVLFTTALTYTRNITFPSERAFANALSWIEKNPNFIPNDLLQFVR